LLADVVVLSDWGVGRCALSLNPDSTLVGSQQGCRPQGVAPDVMESSMRQSDIPSAFATSRLP
jgi:hypothetical protein